MTGIPYLYRVRSVFASLAAPLRRHPAVSTAGILACLLAVALTAAFQLPGVSSNQSETITLPIEVMGPDGYTRTVSMQVSDANAASSVYMQAHSIGYPSHHIDALNYNVDKASVRLNGGAWVGVNNATVECFEPEASQDCVTGPVHTIRFRIPLDRLGNLQEGENVIQFRINYAIGSNGMGDPSMGFRILDLQVQDAGGMDLMTTQMEWDNPGSWTAPSGYGDATSVEAGRQLWHERNILIEGWNGPEIIASCNDCHVEGGYDLEYFAYSNYSIEQRSQFHGLSEAEGKQIAAYIRSIDIETSDGQRIDPPGRPWNPPYQPGLTAAASRGASDARTVGQSMDDMDQVFWAAGAGLEWVLDYDAEIKDYLFPQGVHADAYRIDGTLNMRELPVNLQMPDWNEWLPEFHPLDVWGSDFEQSGAWDWYVNEMPDLIDEDRPWRVEASAERAVQRLWREIKDRWAPPGSSPAPFEHEITRQVPMKWALTKTFEAMQMNHNEEHAQTLYNEQAEPRQWTSQSRVVFDMAPHIIGGKGPGSGIMDRYHDTAWYQHQLTVNPGSGLTTSMRPMDWKYHFQHTSAISAPDAHYWRHLASYMKLVQVAHTVPDDASTTEPRGWYMRHLSPAWIDRTHPQGAPLRSMPDNEYREALNVIMRAYADGITQHSPDAWERLADDQYGLDPASHTPRYEARYDRTTYPNHFWTALQNFGNYGVAYDVLYDLAVWAQEAWPRGDWMAHIEPFQDNPPLNDAPQVSAQTLSLSQGWNIISSRMISDPRPMEEVLAPILDDVLLVKDSRGRPFSPAYDLDVLDTWKPDEAYQIYVTASHDLVVEGTARPGDDPIAVTEGWNFLPYLPTTPMNIEDALSGLGNDLIFVKDMRGDIYLPDPDAPINTIGNMEPGKGYMAYITADRTLQYPSNNSSMLARSVLADASPPSARASAASATLIANGVTWPSATRVWVETEYGERVGTGRIVDGALVATVHEADALSGTPGAEVGTSLVLYAQRPTSSEPEPVETGAVRNLFSGAEQPGFAFQPNAVYVTELTDALPSALTVNGHAPNPVRDQATLSIAIPEETHVRIEVYNTLGQRVATWADRSMPAGAHDLPIEVNGLASGTYFYRVQTDQGTESKRLVVIR